MAGKVVDVTLRLVDKISSPLNSIGGRLAHSANQWAKAGRRIQNAGKAIASTGSSMTRSLTIPIAGAGAACVKLASDFESGMSKVQSISGATGGEIQKLSAKAKEMGAKTKFSATESTEAFSYMAMAGWKTKDMLDGIDGVMYLAGATGEDLATTSDIVTDALTAFGLSASDTNNFVDILAKTSSNANTNVGLMGETFKYVAPVAGSLKYSVNDTALAIGTMANSGIKASNAGTALRSWMTRMAKPTKESQGAMDRLGLSLTDAEGKMKPFRQVMDETRKSMSKLTDDEKAAEAAALAGKTGMSGLLAIVNASDGDFNKLADSINNSTGACKEMYDTANNNLSGQLTILKSTVESIAISFGERMTPYVKKLTAHIQALADKFNSLNDKQKDTIIKVALIAASIGPALLVFGKLVASVGKAVSAIGKIGRAFKKFGTLAGIIASPAGVVIVSLLAIGAAVAIVIKNWNKISAVFSHVGRIIHNAIVPVKPLVASLGKAIGELGKAFSPAINTIKVWFKALTSSKKGHTDAYKGIRQLATVFSSLAVGGLKVALATVKKMTAAIKAVMPAVTALINNGMRRLAVVLKTVSAAIQKVMPVIREGLKNAFGAIIPIIQDAITVLKSIISVIWEELQKCIKAMMPVIENLGTMFRTVFKFIQGVITKFVEFAKPVVTKVISAIAGHIQPTFKTAIEFIGGLLKGFVTTVSGVFQGVMQVFNGIITFITGTFSGNWRQAWEGVKSIFSGVFSTFASIAKAPINAVISVINAAIRSLNKISVDIPDGVPGLGGKHFGVNIATIPALASGTENWKGGLVQISERGGEIVDLPKGSRVYPHDRSIREAYSDGKKAVRIDAGNITITVPKLADKIVVREDADIDKIVSKFADRLEKVSLNLGGADIGYSY